MGLHADLPTNCTQITVALLMLRALPDTRLCQQDPTAADPRAGGHASCSHTLLAALCGHDLGCPCAARVDAADW